MNEQLQELIEAQKQESFTKPEEASDEEALGILVAHWAQWTGEKIVQAFLAALEDANYHTFGAYVEEAWQADQRDSE